MKAAIINPTQPPTDNTDAPIPLAGKPEEDVYALGQPEPLEQPDETITGEWVRPGEANRLLARNTGTDAELFSNQMGSDLDVPGSELDDAAELTGNEDEENNYYSIGGDNHHELEESEGA
jgi:hypothetical protein